jgi:hypothetical protein
MDKETNRQRELELREREMALNQTVLGSSPNNVPIYPSLDDPNLNEKIVRKKEFAETRERDKKEWSSLDVKTYADELLSKRFELAPHQRFVRNFLSFRTPYNSMLLYHGLGTGKTCSAISICEEMRDHMKNYNIKKRIIVVASPNVQENFRLQLFNPSKLKLINGQWNLYACTQNTFLREINPMGLEMTREDILKQVNTLIREYYIFMGYQKFKNYVQKIQARTSTKINKEFSNRLIIIDEVHNIRKKETDKKQVSEAFYNVVKNTDNLKLVFLSATPMFDSFEEIIWLLNLLNLNDGRAPIQRQDIFDKEGNFIEGGRQLFIEKMNGYVSYLKGQNPFTFPFRIFPTQFETRYSLRENINTVQNDINNEPITDELKFIDLYCRNLEETQQHEAYFKIKNTLSKTDELGSREIDNIRGYSKFSPLLQSLNIVFPCFKDKKDDPYREYIGERGLKNSIHMKSNFTKCRYRSKYDRFLSLEHGLKNHSSRIANICEIVEKSEGIVLIYSQYIGGGCVPMALALEEMGFSRYGRANLFETPPREQNGLKYSMIVGNQDLSPNNEREIQLATSRENHDGSQIKVIIISQTGSEGIDLKYIRQVHIMEPWYNMNRNEQVIGRAVRFLSHVNLPFEKRNVEIYLHATVGETNEYADMTIYRMAERKARKIGEISRVMKENSVDCLLSYGANHQMVETIQQTVDIKTSNGSNISYEVGDKPFTETCDYLETCNYKCGVNELEGNYLDDIELDIGTYDSHYIQYDMDVLIDTIKDIFKKQYIVLRSELEEEIKEPTLKVNKALQMIMDERILLEDMFGRRGLLVNVGKQYMFQPIEITDDRIPLHERRHPVDFKASSIVVDMDKPLEEYLMKEPKKLKLKSKSKKITKKPSSETKSVFDFNKYIHLFNKSKGPLSNRRSKVIYDHIQFIRERMNVEIDENIMNQIIVDIILDRLTPNDKRALYEYILSVNDSSMNDIERIFKTNIESRMVMVDDKIMTMIVGKTGKLSREIFEDGRFRKLTKSEGIEYQRVLNERFVKRGFETIIGYIEQFKTTKMYVFKIKKTREKRHKGARCDQAKQSETIRIIKELYGNPNASYDNKSFSKFQSCIEEELLFRYKEKSREDGDKTWFLSTEEAMMSKM